MRTISSDIFVRKLHGSIYSSGLPDIVIIIDGNHFWIEFKRPGGKLTRQQKATLTAIREAGGTAYAFVATDRKTIEVLNPDKDFDCVFELKKTNGHWTGLYEVFGIEKPLTISWP